ncbi:hypothetical protein BAUCODRAFT_135907 [Baudoinia panamericana UAMH 10762]|uniref:Zn(2)-C6 fungal-type domain-containing protein n=1 Tax=Baudoinia panamericana (strain UAMH 10762) TaxID=717646 RepID=M2M258_BAUPA|nr:uncharacterized protein BAUCODRAFT_135907 [Baudoinia panamericana UAMH 10762]EMD01178.1 hypothetical protein BAUCODRAFT_135907 [Baudoinia panamericana UAMH 10762]
MEDEVPKRQRVAWACTNCRRRKAKCNGETPCNPCRLSKLQCSYASGGRMTSTQYIRQLERKVGQLEKLLGSPGSLTSPPTQASPTHDVQSTPQMQWQNTGSSEQDQPDESPPSDDEYIETIVQDDSQPRHSTDGTESQSHELDPVDFGGLRILKRVHNLCKHLGKRGRAEAVDESLANAFEVAPPEEMSTPISWEAFAMMPSRAAVDKAIDIVVDEACCNMQFLDRTTLVALADDVYRAVEADDSNYDRKALALLYAVLALSRQFSHVDASLSSEVQPPKTNGIRYFRASRALLDPASCQDLTALRTLLCMILYTGAANMMSTCYSYICMAVAAALQMGLFNDVSHQKLDDAERKSRRVIYSVLYIADVYVTAALGLPRTLRDIDSERGLPSAVQPTDIHDPLAGTYLHSQLAQILALTVESNHPFIKPIETKNGFYSVEHSKIVAIEAKLDTWFQQLLQRPPETLDPVLMRSQLILRLYHARVQLVLYRPFLHHALRDSSRQTNRPSLKAYACGSACIKAAMQAVWLVERLEASGLFNPSQWFVTFTIFFAAVCLALFVSSNEGAPTVDETADAVRRIKDVCARHAAKNENLGRCLKFLQVSGHHIYMGWQARV